MVIEKAGMAVPVQRVHGSILSDIGEISVSAGFLLDNPEFPFYETNLFK